jgi:hypothetical protein
VSENATANPNRIAAKRNDKTVGCGAALGQWLLQDWRGNAKALDSACCDGDGDCVALRSPRVMRIKRIDCSDARMTEGLMQLQHDEPQNPTRVTCS